MGNETRITKSESNQRCEENEMGNRKPGAKNEDDGVPGETIETMRHGTTKIQNQSTMLRLFWDR